MGDASVVRGNGTSWWVRNAHPLKTTFRLLLGGVWLIDGVLKFTSGYVSNFLGNVQNAQANAPAWLSGWYSFWTAQATSSGTLIVYTVGILEAVLGLALLLGFMRKIAYAGGVVLSLLIWAVPEGFGGPYQTGAGGTDVGTGIIYALAFLGLILINATYGPSRYSLDFLLERGWPIWQRLAEFRSEGRGAGGSPTGGGGP
ncbi:MAG: DoxX family membrane protein [Thermoplasmata archaeon]|nr:DoxX family membrane protein [Thermoplasmata archaeon]